MTALEMKQMAEKFAPVFAQKIDNEWPIADQIAPIDFGGSMADVAENVPKLFAMDHKAVIDNPKVYYSVVETATHVFITYSVYHVFDWWKRDKPRNLYDLIRNRFDEHAHDLEGALVVIRKEPKLTIDAVVTVSHLDFFLYTEPRVGKHDGSEPRYKGAPAVKVVKFNETVDGTIWIDEKTERIRLYIQAKGHGMRGDHAGWGGGDKLWYYKHQSVAGNPSPRKKIEDIKVMPYQLEDVFVKGGLWDHRYNRGTFRPREKGGWGFTCKKKLTEGGLDASSANPPWSWNDHNDTSPIGEMATDPARFITRYAQGWGPVSLQYIRNGYLAI